MDKRELQRRLDAMGLKLAWLCDDLGLARTTSTRWAETVPLYAVGYITLLEELPRDRMARARARVQAEVGRERQKRTPGAPKGAAARWGRQDASS